MEKEAAEFEEAAEIRESPEPIERAPRRGATLEGRVRAMLERRGFRATTNRIVLDHEFDVWAEDRDGRVIVAECKEYYGSGPATSAHIRNFFGKVYDVEKNFGADIYMSLFVCISGFTDSARSLSDRLGITTLDLGTLEIVESSGEELAPRYKPLEDSSILQLRIESERLREELTRRQLVRKLSERIEEYRRTLQTRTIPPFLVPSSFGQAFWYSKSHEIPIVGVDGTFQDYVASAFPQIDGVYFEKRRFFGQRRVVVPAASLKMEGGVIYYVDVAPLTEDSNLPPSPRLSDLHGLTVYTLDGTALGIAIDFLLSFRLDMPMVESVLVRAETSLQERLAESEFTLPGERLSLQMSGGEGAAVTGIVAHVRMSEEALAVPKSGM